MSTDVATLSPAARRAMGRILSDPIFEMIPLRSAEEQAGYLPDGARVSVTASPNLTLDDSLDLAEQLVRRGFRVTPHLSAHMTRDRAHLQHLLARIVDLDVTTAFVVGGDASDDGDYHDGLALLEAMAEIGHHLTVGIPCYPEGHPDIPDPILAGALADKQPHASWMTSQMCFDGEVLAAWARHTRRQGIHLPLVLGLPGVADRTKLLRISARIGVGRSLSFLRKNTGLISAFVRPGGYDPLEFLAGIGDDLDDPELDITGCHIYTFNQCDSTEEWRRRVLESLADSLPG